MITDINTALKKAVAGAFMALGCAFAYAHQPYLERACATLDSIYSHYSLAGEVLLAENFPFDSAYKAGYLGDGAATPDEAPRFAYLWPFSGTLSAWSAVLEASSDGGALETIEQRVVPGIDAYYDTRRTPAAYGSYISAAPLSDRFYDDNIWVGIDFADLYKATGKKKFLDKAAEVWKFIESGTDSVLGGGVYWCEQKKHSKNACSNAPAAVFAMKLYEATETDAYLRAAESLYRWTRSNLRDDADGLYFDNININGRTDRTKFAYNSGQMLQAACMLYKATGEKSYLEDAHEIAENCRSYFFRNISGDADSAPDMLARGNVWFSAVMLRGFCELYELDGNDRYLNAFGACLDYAWINGRDKDSGLFGSDLSAVPGNDEKKWLLTQAAVAEMYARLAKYIKL